MLGARQINPERGSPADLAVNRDGPAGLLGKPVYHAQPEASALARFLGCKEGLKGTTADLLAHARARIGHRYHYVIAQIDVRESAAISASNFRGRNRQSSTCRHSISRVDRKVEDGQLQLARLGHRRP